MKVCSHGMVSSVVIRTVEEVHTVEAMAATFEVTNEQANKLIDSN